MGLTSYTHLPSPLMPADPFAKHCRRSLSRGSVVLDRLLLAWIAISRSCLAVPGIWKTKTLMWHGFAFRHSAETRLSTQSIPNSSLASCWWKFCRFGPLFPSPYNLLPEREIANIGHQSWEEGSANHPVLNPDADRKLCVRIFCLQCDNTVTAGGCTQECVAALYPQHPYQASSTWPGLQLAFDHRKTKTTLAEDFWLWFTFVPLRSWFSRAEISPIACLSNNSCLHTTSVAFLTQLQNKLIP